MKAIALTILSLILSLPAAIGTRGGVLLVFKKPELSPCGLFRNDQNQEVRWNNYPVHFYIEENVAPTYHEAIRDAATQWNQRLGFEAIKIEDQLASSPKTNTDYNIIYAENDPKVLGPKIQAVTHLTWIRDNTHSANIVINFAHYKFSTDTVDSTMVDMVSVMIHEFGHVFSLPHSDAEPSVMGPILENGLVRQRISDLDKASVVCAVARKADTAGSEVAKNP